MRQPPGRLDRLFADGTLAKTATECRTQAELAAKLGITSDAFTGWRIRRRGRGDPAPTFDELKKREPGVLTDAQTASVAAAFGAWDSTAPVANYPTSNATIASPTWPNLAAFDSTAGSPPTNTGGIRKLTRAECPDGTMILWASDIHIPIHAEVPCRLMVECAERVGVSRVVAGGDILDMNCLSKHAKEAHRVVAHSTILEEIEPGRWLLNWMASRECDFILGNHEDRLRRFVDENPVFHGSLVQDFARVCELPDSINVLDGEVRLGNLSMFHGHKEFKNGTGGRYPAQKILDMFPDQSSIFGHLHRSGTAYRTTRDEDGINRTRRAYAMPHMSIEHEHYNYVSRSPNWQTGFGLIHVYWEDDRPRFNVDQIEILFDRYNRPYFAHAGVVYR